MAITKVETQVTWPTASNTGSLTANSTLTSEEFNLNDACFQAQISLKALNGGAPVAADKVDIYLLQTSGDPDGAIQDEFDSAHASTAVFLGTLDTSAINPPVMTVRFPVPQKGCKLYADGTRSVTTQTITVSATVTEQRG